MKLFSFLFRQSPRNLVLAVVAGAASGLASAALLVLINDLLQSGSTWNLGRRGTFVLFVGLCLAVPLARVVASYLLIRLGQGAIHEMRLHLTRQILRTPLRRLEAMGPHRLMVVLTDDLNSAMDSLVSMPTLVMNAFLVLGGLVYLAWLSPVLVVGVLVLMVVAVVSYQLPLLQGVRRLRRAREEEDTLFHHFEGLIRGNKELKLHGRRRSAFTSRVEGTSGTLRHLNLTAETILAVTASWGQALIFVMVGTILFFGADLFGVDRATLVGYTLVMLYLMTPAQFVMNSVPVLSRASVAVRKVEDLGLDLGSRIEPEAPAADEAPSWSTLELRDVVYEYGDEEHSFRLGPLNLTFAVGETTFLVGGNGSGKTTLLKVLMGLYTPDSGEILLDGVPIDPKVDGYREQFSAVLSDFHLFEELLGLEPGELEQNAGAYLRRLELQDKVTVEDGVLSTIDLSRGQRKRLALLTAFLEDRPVYVLDEWAADQDPYFVSVFYREILSELKTRGKTIIAASHDDRYFDVADRLIKMEFGQVQLDRRVEGLEGGELVRIGAPRAVAGGAP